MTWLVTGRRQRGQGRTGAPGFIRGRALVGLFEQLDHALPGLGLPEEADEPLVLQVPGDVLQRPEVVAGLVRRRDQQEEDIDGVAVEGREVDPSTRQGDGPDEAMDRGVAGVGDGHALADPGGTQLLSTEDGTDDALEIGLGDLAGVAQALDDLADRLFLAGRVKGDEDGLAAPRNPESFIQPSIVVPPGPGFGREAPRTQPPVGYIEAPGRS